MQKYYDILGVPATASVAEIKRAYHKKAMTLHPDRNNSPNANAQFDLLHDAYEYLIDLKTGKITAASADEQVQDFAKWWRREEARTRQQNTRKRAWKVRYKQREDPEDEKANAAVDAISNLFLVLVSFAVVFVIPIVAAIHHSWFGFWWSMVLLFVCLPIIAATLSILREFNSLLKDLKNAAVTIVKTNWFIAIFLIVLNFLLFFNFTLNTLVSNSALFFFFGILPLGVYVAFLYLLPKHKYQHRKNTISFCLLPLFINGLLLINYFVSFNPVQEQYFFGPDGGATAIKLENGTYDEYLGMRFYVTDQHLRAKGNTIVYTFKKGILGLRVMTDYKVTYRDEPYTLD